MSAEIEAQLEVLQKEVKWVVEELSKPKRFSAKYWVKTTATICASIFAAGVVFNQVQQDVVTKKRFNPVVERVSNLERSLAGMAPRMEKLEVKVSSLNVKFDGVTTELSSIGVKMDTLIQQQKRAGRGDATDRYCSGLLIDYTRQIHEYSTKIRRKKPEFSRELETCRIGDKPS